MAVTVRTQERPPFWRDATVLKWLAQLGVLALVLLFFRILGNEASENFRRANTSFGFQAVEHQLRIRLARQPTRFRRPRGF